LIPIEDKSSSYFLGPVGISDPLNLLKPNIKESPSSQHYQELMSGKTPSKTSPCLQLQVGGTGIREYSKIKA
jgi:hypothetical protein